MIIVLAAAMALQDPQPSLDYCLTQVNTIEINMCAAARVDEEEKRMQAYLTAASQALDRWDDNTDPSYEVDLPANLQAAQTAWVDYAKAECELILQQNIDGSIRGVMFLSCKEELAFERTRRLWAIAVAAGADLPEPTVAASEALIAALDVPKTLEN